MDAGSGGAHRGAVFARRAATGVAPGATGGRAEAANAFRCCALPRDLAYHRAVSLTAKGALHAQAIHRVGLVAALLMALGAAGIGCQAGGRIQGEDHHHQEPPAVAVLVGVGVRRRRCRRAKIDKIWPSEEKGESGKWNIEYMAFFAQPLNDSEIQVKFFDITGGEKRYVAGDAQYTREKGSRIFGSSIELAKPEFDVRKHYKMNIEIARAHHRHDPVLAARQGARATAARSSSATRMRRRSDRRLARWA